MSELEIIFEMLGPEAFEENEDNVLLRTIASAFMAIPVRLAVTVATRPW